MILSPEEFVALRASEDPDEYRRSSIEHADIGVWLQVIDRFPDFRKWVAHNKTIPEEVIRILATDPNEEVRWTIAMKRGIPADVLANLSGDNDETIRNRIARHPRVSRAILLRLSDDPSAVVADVARRRLADAT